MAPETSYPEFLLPMAGEQVFIHIDDIIYLEAKGSYTDIYLGDGRKTRISKKLKSALAFLASDLFVRIHHSYIINLKNIAAFKNGESAYLHMKDGSTIPISRSRKADFLKLFKRL